MHALKISRNEKRMVQARKGMKKEKKRKRHRMVEWIDKYMENLKEKKN